MRTMVEFRVSGVSYCLPVEVTRAVRSTKGMVALPSPAASVAGLLPGDPPLTVMSPFGAQGNHVIVLELDGEACGLLVDSVIGLRRIDELDIRPPPRGQQRRLVSGSLNLGGEMVLVLDPKTVVSRSEVDTNP